MTLLSRAKATPPPEPYTRHWINAPFEDIELFTSTQVRAAREQIAAEGDEVIGRLCEALEAICNELEDGDDFSAKQIARNAGRAALAEARKA